MDDDLAHMTCIQQKGSLFPIKLLAVTDGLLYDTLLNFVIHVSLYFISRAVCQHPEAYVRKAVLLAASSVLMALPPSYVASALVEGNAAISDGLEWVRKWALHVVESDSDRECYTVSSDFGKPWEGDSVPILFYFFKITGFCSATQMTDKFHCSWAWLVSKSTLRWHFKLHEHWNRQVRGHWSPLPIFPRESLKSRDRKWITKLGLPCCLMEHPMWLTFLQLAYIWVQLYRVKM